MWNYSRLGSRDSLPEVEARSVFEDSPLIPVPGNSDISVFYRPTEFITSSTNMQIIFSTFDRKMLKVRAFLKSKIHGLPWTTTSIGLVLPGGPVAQVCDPSGAWVEGEFESEIKSLGLSSVEATSALRMASIGVRRGSPPCPGCIMRVRMGQARKGAAKSLRV